MKFIVAIFDETVDHCFRYMRKLLVNALGAWTATFLTVLLVITFAGPAKAVVTLICHSAQPPDDVIEIDQTNGVARFVQNMFISGQTRPASVNESSIVIQYGRNTRWVINRASGALVIYDFGRGSWLQRGAGMIGDAGVCRRTQDDDILAPRLR